MIRKLKSALVALFYVQKRLRYLYLPNLGRLMKGRLQIRNKLWDAGENKFYVNQCVKMTGEGTVAIGSACTFGYKLGGYHYKGRIELQPRYAHSRIEIGDRVATNNNIFLCCTKRITIGDDCLIGHDVEFLDSDGHALSPSRRRDYDTGLSEPIVIGKNVWLGNNVQVLRGTEIGDNSVVAAGAVVKGKFGCNVVIGGVPGKVIRTIDENE